MIMKEYLREKHYICMHKIETIFIDTEKKYYQHQAASFNKNRPVNDFKDLSKSY
jgi:hypothetical protein